MASEGVSESGGTKEEEGGAGAGVKTVPEDDKSGGLDSSSQTSLAGDEPKTTAVLTNGIIKGDGHLKSEPVPNDDGRQEKLPGTDSKSSPSGSPETVPRREQVFSRQNSDRGGNGEKPMVVNGPTGELKNEATDIEVSDT